MNETPQHQANSTPARPANDAEAGALQRSAAACPHPLLGRVFSMMGCTWFFFIWHVLLLGLAVILNVHALAHAWSATLIAALNLLIIIQAVFSGPVLLALHRWSLKAGPSKGRLACPFCGKCSADTATLAARRECPALSQGAEHLRRENIPPEAKAEAKLDHFFSQSILDEQEQKP